MAQDSILKVAVNRPISTLFDYLPPGGGSTVAPGSRVRVPFGRGYQIGLVMTTAGESSVPATKLKRAQEVLDPTPLLPPDALWLISFTADYYHHPIGEVAAAALPAVLRQGKALHPVHTVVSVTDAGAHADFTSLGTRAPRQAELLQSLIDAGGNGVDTDVLSEQNPNWRRAYRALAGKGWATSFELRPEQTGTTRRATPTPGPELTRAQHAAVDSVRSAADFAVHLLDGVTGSGKTEVYLQLIETVLAREEQTLVLVPEIGLTPQLVRRFRERLGVEPALLHSALTDKERLVNWRRAVTGDALLIVGTRSAVFTPLPRPGLFIVDEEHDQSFKQQEGLRYSARDLAIARAKHAGKPIVLGSATPSLEMLLHCREGNYTHLPLPERAGGASQPVLQLVDIARDRSDDGFSRTLTQSIEHHLANDGQVLLFLNRRGFAPTLICPACGHIAECRRCDARMTVHARDRRLRCHHCGAGRPLDAACTECGSTARPLGAGTERLEDALAKRYPDRNIIRIDSDSVASKAAIDAALSAAVVGEADILVGTQMLSKGHHFPNLTLVGIINADQGLFGTDFRSDERMAQSIIQVAGRAGRENRQGEVLIQTAFPRHPFWQRLLQSGYAGIADEVLAERAASRWPPYSRLALLRASAHLQSEVRRFLGVAARLAGGVASKDVRLLGPVDAAMARKAGRYRAQLLLQSSNRAALHRVLRSLRPQLEAEPKARKVRWSIDVDPLELF